MPSSNRCRLIINGDHASAAGDLVVRPGAALGGDGTLGGNLMTCVPSMDSGPTLIALEDDPRLERNRTERAYFGHPTGPAAEAVARAELHGKVSQSKSEPEPSLQAISNLGLGNGETSRTYAKECPRKTPIHLEIQLP